MSTWGEIRTRYIWELIQQTTWEDRAKIIELMDIEESLHHRYDGGPRLNRIEENYIKSLLEKYPDEWERIESELQIRYIAERGLLPSDVFPDEALGDGADFADDADNADDTDCTCLQAPGRIIEAVEQAFRERDIQRSDGRAQGEAEGEGKLESPRDR